MRVRGPIVRGLFGAFAENWLEATGEVLVGDGYTPELEGTDDGGPMQLVRSSAGVGDTNVEALYYLAIAAAQRVARPHRGLLRAAPGVHRGARRRRRARRARAHPRARRAHRQGPCGSAGRASYDELLEAGVELYEYGPTMLHAKSLVLDGVWSSVGSVNFDNRSFQLHDEATLCVQSRDFAAELDASSSSATSRSPTGSSRSAGPAAGACSGASESVMKLARREL